MNTLTISPLLQTVDRRETAKLLRRLRPLRRELLKSGKHLLASPVMKIEKH
jgi:hypothetical protein